MNVARTGKRLKMWIALLILTGCGHKAAQQGTTGELPIKAVGPFAQCRWDYVNGLEAFKNSATTPGFDKQFNPVITVSRRSLTARVVGILSDATLTRFGGSLDRVVEAYPYLTPVRYTAIHRVVTEDIDQDADYRIGHPGGEIIETTVVELPANAVMIVYPVSIAAPGMNTAAGNWMIFAKDRSRPSSGVEEQFGGFPFLKYTTQGHALHGPITGDRTQGLWILLRGKVSHGCNRMEGEHIVELSVLLGCSAKGITRTCAKGNERVTVMEEFDYFPNPTTEHQQIGIASDFADIADSWVTPELPAYPRDVSAPLPYGDVLKPGWLVLEKTENKGWTRNVAGVTSLLVHDRPGAGAVRLRNFVVWDNRQTEGTSHQYVKGIDCKN